MLLQIYLLFCYSFRNLIKKLLMLFHFWLTRDTGICNPAWIQSISFVWQCLFRLYITLPFSIFLCLYPLSLLRPFIPFSPLSFSNQTETRPCDSNVRVTKLGLLLAKLNWMFRVVELVLRQQDSLLGARVPDAHIPSSFLPYMSFM